MFRLFRLQCFETKASRVRGCPKRLKYALAARHALHVTRRSHSHRHGTGKRLENRFQAVMIVVTVEELYMQIHAGVFAEALEEMFEHAGFDATSGCSREFHVPDKADTVAEVDAHAAQSFVHRDKIKAVTFDTLLVAKAFHKRLPQHDCDIFHAVVHIHFDIALACQIQMEPAVNLEQVKHMIQKAGTGTDFTPRSVV